MTGPPAERHPHLGDLLHLRHPQGYLWKYIRQKTTASNAWNTGAGAVVAYSAPTSRITPGDVLISPTRNAGSTGYIQPYWIAGEGRFRKTHRPCRRTSAPSRALR